VEGERGGALAVEVQPLTSVRAAFDVLALYRALPHDRLRVYVADSR
jgi:hypothetical protein